jgi:hypothetical protein
METRYTKSNERMRNLIINFKEFNEILVITLSLFLLVSEWKAANSSLEQLISKER